MDVVCTELNEIKSFAKETQRFIRDALIRMEEFDNRISSLEGWREQVTHAERLKKRFGYDLRSAVAGGFAGGGAGALLAWLFKFLGGG